MTADAVVREVVVENDHETNGWCSLCGKKSERAVRVKLIGQTGGGIQAMPHETKSMNVDRYGEPIPPDTYFYYRFGACCIGKMINAIERA